MALIAGLGYAAHRLDVSDVWIAVGALVIIGLGLMGGIVKTRQKNPASQQSAPYQAATLPSGKNGRAIGMVPWNGSLAIFASSISNPSPGLVGNGK